MEPLVQEIAGKIIQAIDKNGGRAEPFPIPKEQWKDFQDAYRAQFGGLVSLKFDRVNLVLCGVPVYQE